VLMKTPLFFLILMFALFLVVSAFRSAEAEQPAGEQLYRKNCMRCHGADGTRGLLGARNLRRSILNDSAIKNQILAGKGFMPSFRKKLREPELDALVVYIKSLRAE